MGITFIAASLEAVSARLEVREDLCTAGHIVHGGALMAFADTVGAAATALNLPETAGGTTTLESKTNFLRGTPEPGSTLTATATSAHRGRRAPRSGRTRIETDDGKLMALVTQELRMVL